MKIFNKRNFEQIRTVFNISARIFKYPCVTVSEWLSAYVNTLINKTMKICIARYYTVFSIFLNIL